MTCRQSRPGSRQFPTDPLADDRLRALERAGIFTTADATVAVIADPADPADPAAQASQEAAKDKSRETPQDAVHQG